MTCLYTNHYIVIIMTLNEVASQQEDLIKFIKDELHLPSESEKVDLPTLYNFFTIATPIRPDLMYRVGNSFYFIEIKNKVSVDTIARMNLLRDLWRKIEDREKNVAVIIAAKVIPPRERDLAKELGIQIIKIPWTEKSAMSHDYVIVNSRITSEKAWKVISHLLKEQNISIRQLGMEEKVSYGWTYRTINNLINQNIIEKNGYFLKISDINKLLNGIAWERPINNLKIEEIPLNYQNIMTAAVDISKTYDDEKIPVAFTAFTSAGLYTGHTIRHDKVYLYLNRDLITSFKELFGAKEKGEINAVIYQPDRDVFSDTRVKESIRVTSPGQTLLDIAGFGYAGIDLAKAMVNLYGSL